MPNWKKVIVSGSDASLNKLVVDTEISASIFSGSAFSGSFYGDGSELTGIIVDDGLPDNGWDFNIPDETPINDFVTQSLVYIIDFNNLPLVGTEAGKIGWFGNASGETQLIPSDTGLYIVAGDSTVGYITPSGYSGSIVGIGNVMNYSASVDNKWKQTATTGSNIFNEDQIISGSVFISGTTEFGGNLVPKEAHGATLGTSERPFAEIFIQSGSLNIASDVPGDPNTTLSNIGGNILVSAGGMRLVEPGNSFIAETGSFQYISGSLIQVGNYERYGNTILIGDQETTGSLKISGSLKVNNQEVVLGPLGWARYDDTQYTTSSALLITTGSEPTLPNNGGFRIETQLHSSIPFYNSGSQKIQVENSGDVYLCTITFRAKTADAPSTYLRIQLDSTSGTPYSRVGKDLFFPRGNDVWHEYHEVFQYYGDEDFVTNGNRWKIRAYNEDVSIADVIFFIQRTQNHLS